MRAEAELICIRRRFSDWAVGAGLVVFYCQCSWQCIAAYGGSIAAAGNRCALAVPATTKENIFLDFSKLPTVTYFP